MSDENVFEENSPCIRDSRGNEYRILEKFSGHIVVQSLECGDFLQEGESFEEAWENEQRTNGDWIKTLIQEGESIEEAKRQYFSTLRLFDFDDMVESVKNDEGWALAIDYVEKV